MKKVFLACLAAVSVIHACETNDVSGTTEGEGGGTTEGALAYPYTETFTGDGTYYGYTDQGHCSIYEPQPAMYDGMIPVAINKEQYSDSWVCGACVEGRGTGGGSGHNPIPAFKGFISDECPECKWGDLDLSQSGDGRWDIEWNFVLCPGGSPTFEFQGSNPWYWKVQPQGTSSPVDELFVNNKMARKTIDNFFEVTEGGPFYGKQEVRVKTITGQEYTNMVGI